MATQLVPLGEVCAQNRISIRTGQRPDLRYIGMETIQSNSGQLDDSNHSKTPESPLANSFYFDQAHVLYGKLRPYLNKVLVPDFEGKCSTEIIPLRPSSRLNRAYLAYFLRSPRTISRITAKTSGARMPRADMDFVLGLPIPLPTIHEQNRIVDLLSCADGIVRLRHEAQTKVTDLIPAIFVEMFGDPRTNPKGWPVRRVSDFVAKFEGGKNLQAGDHGATVYRILKVSAATTGKYLESESKPTPNDYVPPANHIVREGDLLFSRANTVELVGATAIVEATNGNALLPDKLWRFVWSESLEPRYMHALFQNAHVRTELGKLSSGTSASMRNISQAKLYELRLPVAPFELQREFARLAAQVQSILTQQSSAIEKAEAMFDALLSKTFPHSRGALNG